MYERGLSQKALSEFLGISSLKNYEYRNGEKWTKHFKSARDISRKLDIEVPSFEFSEYNSHHEKEFRIHIKQDYEHEVFLLTKPSMLRRLNFLPFPN